MIRQTVLTAFLAALIMLFPASAFAQTDKETAEHLRSLFQDIIDYQESISSLGRGGQFVFQGAVEVEPLENYYAITLPHTSIVYPDGRRTRIGMISINAVPHSEAKQWKMSVAIPTPILAFDTQGNKALQVDIGKQAAAGIWHEDLQHFVKLDARYQGISLRSFDGRVTALIPEASALYDLKQDESGLWSGPAKLSLTNISLDVDNGSQTLNLGGFEVFVDLKAYDPKALRTYKENISAMVEGGGSIGGPGASSQHTLGLYNMIFELLTKAVDAADISYSLSGLTLAGHEQNEEQTPFKLTLDEAQFNLKISGLRSDRSAFALNFGYDGLAVTPPENGDLAPSDVNIDIAIKNLPHNDLVTLGRNTLQGMIESPKLANIARITFIAKLPAILSQAETAITINKNHFGNDSYNVSLDGEIAADIKALNGATADMTATFRGLDWLIGALSKQTDGPDDEKPEDAQKLAGRLKMFRDLARAEKNTLGQLIHILEIVMNPQGQILINGEDVREKFSPQPQPEPAPPADSAE